LSRLTALVLALPPLLLSSGSADTATLLLGDFEGRPSLWLSGEGVSEASAVASPTSTPPSRSPGL